MPRCSAVVQCPFCNWSAKHSADDPKEVAEFLSRLRTTHVSEKHAEAQS